MPLEVGTAGAATPGSVTLNHNIPAGSRPLCRGSRQKHGRKGVRGMEGTAGSSQEAIEAVGLGLQHPKLFK